MSHLALTDVLVSKVKVFLVDFVSKEAQILTSLPPFWTVLSSQGTFSWCHSVHKILSKWLLASIFAVTLGYGCSWAILFWGKHAPNSKNDSSEDSEVDDHLEKYILLTLWRMQNQLQVFLQFQVRWNDVT